MWRALNVEYPVFKSAVPTEIERPNEKDTDPSVGPRASLFLLSASTARPIPKQRKSEFVARNYERASDGAGTSGG